MKIKAIITAVLGVSVLTGTAIHFAHADADDKPTTAPAATATGDTKSDAKPGEKSDEPKPIATVTTTPLRAGDLSQSISAYGSVTAQPGTIAIFSVPYESRVRKIQVTAGQPVDNGTALVEVEPSPAARQAWLEAESTLDAATKDLAQVQQRFDMKLGTNSDLATAQQAARLAQLRLDSLKQQQLDVNTVEPRSVSADGPGVVAKIDTQQGQVVAGGSALAETIARDQVEVRLGVEPSQIAKLALGQEVHLFAGNNSDFIAGKIRLITQRVNPETRLVDIFVTPENRESLLLDGFIRGEIISTTKAALIAPRNAVLPDDEGLLLYTIKDGHAVKHVVTRIVGNNVEVGITGADLSAGDQVVVQGNLELEDGMNVAVEKSGEAHP